MAILAMLGILVRGRVFGTQVPCLDLPIHGAPDDDLVVIRNSNGFDH
jgi:hypothetical protein